jgi:hypothetical protein
MSALPSLLSAGQARAASTDAALLAKAAKNAQGALQWAMAASLYTQAADALPKDVHTGRDTTQAQAHRRSAQICSAMKETRAPQRLLKDAPDYGAAQRQLLREAEAEANRFWSPA